MERRARSQPTREFPEADSTRSSARASASCGRARSITFTMERDLDGALAPLAGRAFNGLAFAEHLDVTGASAHVLARFPRRRGQARRSGCRHVAARTRARHTDWHVSVGGVRTGSRQDARDGRAAAAAGRQRRRCAGNPHRRRRRPRRSALSRVIRRDPDHCHQPWRDRRSGSRFRSARIFRKRSGRTWRQARRSTSCKAPPALPTRTRLRPAMSWCW